MSFLIWKWRRYPIRRDELGRSLRQQAFELFDNKLRPSKIFKQQLLPAKLKTLLRYFEDWKKIGDHNSYRITKKVKKNNPDFTEMIIKSLSNHLEMPVEEVRKRMLRPWGLKQALRGQWPDYGLEREQSDVEAPLILDRCRKQDGFFVVPVAAGGLTYENAAAVVGECIGIEDLRNWNIRKVSTDPISAVEAREIAVRVLQRRIESINSYLPPVRSPSSWF